VRGLILFGIGDVLEVCLGDANGNKLRKLQVESIIDGDYYIKFVLRNKVDGFRWALLSV